MSREPRGGSMSELFMHSHVPHTRPDGVTIRRLASRWRWCFAAVTAHDEIQPIDMTHALPCRIHDLIERWKRDGSSAPVVEEYDAVVAMLDAADARRPQ